MREREGASALALPFLCVGRREIAGGFAECAVLCSR